jgi:hypothetical protein
MLCSKLDQNTMMLISKYFNSIQDYINLVKTNKEYLQLNDLYRYNPISKENINNIDLILNTFPQIEEYCIYINALSFTLFPEGKTHNILKLKNMGLIIENVKKEINEVREILKDKCKGIHFKLIFLKQEFTIKFYVDFSLTIEENMNNTNINCKDCKDCLFCENCMKCEECITCINCEECNECMKCNECKESMKCEECNECTKSTICIKSMKCEDCTKCEECEECNECKRSINCIKCIDCHECRRCKSCYNCMDLFNYNERRNVGVSFTDIMMHTFAKVDRKRNKQMDEWIGFVSN